MSETKIELVIGRDQGGGWRVTIDSVNVVARGATRMSAIASAIEGWVRSRCSYCDGTGWMGTGSSSSPRERCHLWPKCTPEVQKISEGSSDGRAAGARARNPAVAGSSPAPSTILSAYSVDVPAGQWTVQVLGGADGADWKTMFVSGVQGFEIARAEHDDEEGKQRCEWFRDQFRKAMAALGAPPELTPHPMGEDEDYDALAAGYVDPPMSTHDLAALLRRVVGEAVERDRSIRGVLVETELRALLAAAVRWSVAARKYNAEHPDVLCTRELPPLLEAARAYEAAAQSREQRRDDAPVRRAAVSMVEKEGKLLCVWNRRYEGWSLPGGMVEDGETVEEAQRRELAEETGLETLEREQVFEGEHGLTPSAGDRGGRARIVHVFRVTTAGRPQETEPGCPIDWLTPEEFVERSPFGAFYAKVFAKVRSGDVPPIDLPAPDARHVAHSVLFDQAMGAIAERDALRKALGRVVAQAKFDPTDAIRIAAEALKDVEPPSSTAPCVHPEEPAHTCSHTHMANLDFECKGCLWRLHTGHFDDLLRERLDWAKRIALDFQRRDTSREAWALEQLSQLAYLLARVWRCNTDDERAAHGREVCDALTKFAKHPSNIEVLDQPLPRGDGSGEDEPARRARQAVVGSPMMTLVAHADDGGHLHVFARAVDVSSSPIFLGVLELYRESPKDTERALAVLPAELEGRFWNDVRNRLAVEFMKVRMETRAQLLKDQPGRLAEVGRTKPLSETHGEAAATSKGPGSPQAGGEVEPSAEAAPPATNLLRIRGCSHDPPHASFDACPENDAWMFAGSNIPVPDGIPRPATYSDGDRVFVTSWANREGTVRGWRGDIGQWWIELGLPSDYHAFEEKYLQRISDIITQPDRAAAKLLFERIAHIGAHELRHSEAAYVLAMHRRLGETKHLRTAWPPREVVDKLAHAVSHLLADHDCDAHGHELYKAALDKTREWLRATGAG